MVNARYMSFAQSVSQALPCAVERGPDLAVLHCNGVLSFGALAEMRQVADLDPMICFVNLGSNSASIGSLLIEIILTRPRPTPYSKSDQLIWPDSTSFP